MHQSARLREIEGIQGAYRETPVKITEEKAAENVDWFEEGRQLMQEGHLNRAIQTLNLAIDHKIKIGKSYFARGVCHYKLGNYLQAKIDLEAAAVLGCKDAQLWSKYDQKRYQLPIAGKKAKLND